MIYEIEIIENWAEGRDFDMTFVWSLKEQYSNRGSLTDKQMCALRNIIEKFHIDEELYSFDNGKYPGGHNDPDYGKY